MQEIAQLAPAAGHGIGKVIAENLLARPGFVDTMGDVIWNALTAEKRVWDKEANSGKGGWVVEPDTRSQLQAFFGLIANLEGEPIKRIIHQHLGVSGKTVSTEEALTESPALRAAVERALAKSKPRAATSAERAAKATPVEAVLEVE